MSESQLKRYMGLHEKDILEILSLKDASSNFKVRVRTNLNRNGEHSDYSTQCNNWVKTFGESTKTQWIVRNSWPNLKTIPYRKLFVCHHSNFNKVRDGDRIRGNNRIKGKSCEATIDIKIKKVNRFTVRNDSHLKDGLSAIIMINFEHSHLIQCGEAFSFLNMSESTRSIFLDYFKDGMTPSTAKIVHELKIMDAYAAEDIDFHLADAQVNPRDREIIYLFDEWRKAELNATSKPEVQSVESIPGNSSQQLDIGYFAEPTPSSSQTEDIKNRPTEIPKDRPKENPKNRPTENPKNRPTEKRNYSGKVYCRMCLEPIGARNQMVPLTLMDINFPTKSAAFKKSKEMETYRITDMIQVVMPDFDFDAAYNPIVCHKCIVRLESAYNFIKGCQENENMIQLYKSEYCPDEELVSCEDVALNKSLLMEQSSPRKKRKTSKGHISSGSLPAQSGSQIEQRGNTTAEHYEIVYTSSVGQENLIPETSSELRTAIKCETDDYEDYKLDGDSHFLVQPEEVSCIVKEEIVVKEDVSCDFTDTTNNERIAQMSMDYHVKDEVCSQPDALSISDTGDYHTNSTQYSTTNQNSQTFSRPKT